MPARYHDIFAKIFAKIFAQIFARMQGRNPGQCDLFPLVNFCARESGLIMMPDDLAPAARACGDPVVLSAETLAGIGSSPMLTDALAIGGWDAP